MNWEESLRENFYCSKCRSMDAVVKKGSVSGSGLPKIMNSGKYIFVTCADCGYTEMYDYKIYVKSKAEESASDLFKKPVPKTSTSLKGSD